MKSIDSKGKRLLKQNKWWSRWRGVVGTLACVVVFFTTYALILPAITMTKDTQRVLACPLSIHHHASGCYNDQGKLTCGKADFVVHVHNENCYNSQGSLVCTLPEIRAHEHSGSCYDTVTDLVCTRQEKAGHTHGDGCYSRVKGGLTCEETGEEHEHTDDCYSWSNELTCGKEESQGHTHGGDCFESKTVRICSKAVLHKHSDSCYNGGRLSCGLLELSQHVHSSGCFVEREVQKSDPSDAPAETTQSTEEPEETAAAEETTEATEEAVEETVESTRAAEETVESTQPEETTESTEAAEETTESTEETAEAAEETTESTEAEEEPSLRPDGPVYPTNNGTVTAHGGGYSGIFGFRAFAMPLAETGPIDVSSFVVAQNSEGAKTQLLYKRPGETNWTVVTADTTIPGDASLQLNIVYKDVPIANLQAAGNQLTYTLPGYMKDVTAQGNITAGNTVVGNISVNGNTATITFNDSFLQTQVNEGHTLLDGTFYVESRLDLSKVDTEKPGSLVIGNINIGLNFDGDLVAQYGNVDVEKSVGSNVIEAADGDYLEYTLTVTAGPDGSPDVKVVDRFTNTTFIAQYQGVTGIKTAVTSIDGITETGAPDSNGGYVYLGTADMVPAGEGAAVPGTLVWEIGNMAANETRTLTYRVRLTETYTGVQSKGALTNTADVYSKTYKRDTDSVTFTPNFGMNERKSSAEPVKNEDGTYTITYTVWLKGEHHQTHAINSYTLDNVKIVDSLNHPNNTTLEKYLDYLSYVPNSFKLYKGNGTSGEQLPTPTNPHEGQGNPVMNADGKGFTYYVGDVAPNEEYTLTYQVIVEPGFFTKAGNDVGTVKNRALLYLDDTRSDAQKNQVQAYSHNRDMAKKQWDRKLVGEQTAENQTIPMPGMTPESFEVPAGSYLYTVIVNETGDWDVSSASMTDTLGNHHMQFVGYVRVDAYDITGAAPSGTDEQVAANLANRTPSKTVWVPVDGQGTFNFTPAGIGMGSGSYAIRMTYYAKPVEMAGITQVVVANKFNLSGTVGYGDYSYVLGGIGVSGSVTVSGANSFHAGKTPWYYDPGQAGYTNGAIYWVIELDADMIPSGTDIKDTTPAGQDGDHKGSRLMSDCVAGVYRGSLPDITQYSSLAQAAAHLTEVESSKYRVDLSQGRSEHELHLTFSEDIHLSDGESVYIVVRSQPEYLPALKRDAFYYQNKLEHRFGDGTYIEDNTAVKYLYGSENILKELNNAFTWDGTTKTVIQNGKGGDVVEAAYRDQPGTYVAWNIKVNYMGNLSGKYTITDHIPDGMELVYARLKWLGPEIPDRTNTNHQFTPRNNPGGWEEHSITAGTDGCGTRTTYYYTNGNQVCWDIVDLVAGNERDKYSVDFQVLCRVADANALLGGEKTFNNTVTLTNTEGRHMGTDSDAITIRKQTLAKQGTYDPDVNGGRYPFMVKLNDLGEDLVPGASTVTLVDTMSNSLKLDVDSIKVKNTKNDTLLAADSYSIAVEGQTLKITVPDDQPLTITYEALVQAAPGAPVNISNNAHWEGYTAPSSGQVSVESFSYSAGGTASTSNTPNLKLVKLDQYNASLHLQGAKFTVTEMELSDGAFVVKAGGQVWADCTTEEDGTVTVGKSADNLMQWNKVYRIVETAAPEGYVMDSTPHYFAVAKKVSGVDSDAEPTYPDILESYAAAGAEVYYLGAEYEYQAFNHKGSATLEKVFIDQYNNGLTKVDGKYTFGIYLVEGDSETLIDKQTLTIAHGSTDHTVTFVNLELEKTYRIYELDDSGNPVKGGTAMVDHKLFDVTYDGNTVTFEDGTTASVKATNTVHYTALPQTGSTGTGPLYGTGAFLMAAAALLLLLKKRRTL